MAAGHLAMTFDATFLFALLLLVLGSGCLKGNISAQVGTLYPPDAESLRARGFTIFSTGINIGAVLGPLATGAAQEARGFHAGFGIAAGLMMVALGVYLFGSRYLPDTRPASADRKVLPPLTAEEKRRTWALIGLIALTLFPNIAYPMIWNIGIIWIDGHVNLGTPLGAVPPSWFNSVDAFASIVVAAPLVALWSWQAQRKTEPSGLTKIAIGCAITAASAFLMAGGCLTADGGGKLSVFWALAGFFGMGVAFMWYWPITLTLVSQAAPAKVNSTTMGGAFLSLFAGTVIMGWVGSFYDQMSNAAFWALDGMIAFAGMLITLAVRRPLSGILEPAASRPA
jgi:POT family proton-dependent oligopeptide transporter